MTARTDPPPRDAPSVQPPGRAGKGGGEHVVVGAERLPLPGEAWPEARLVRRVVEHVVDEPQGGVRDGVVGALEDGMRDVQHPYRGTASSLSRVEQPLGRRTGRGPVGVAKRRADPQHVRVVSDCGQAGHHAAAAAFRRQAAIVAPCKRDRPPVGRDEYLPAGVALRPCATSLMSGRSRHQGQAGRQPDGQMAESGIGRDGEVRLRSERTTAYRSSRGVEGTAR